MKGTFDSEAVEKEEGKSGCSLQGLLKGLLYCKPFIRGSTLAIL